MSNLINISEETTFTIQVNYCDLTITKKFMGNEEQISVTGIVIKPNWIEVKPNKFRSLVISKKDSALSIDEIYNDLIGGIYYLNIKDYSEHELKIACEYLTSKWTDEIWTSITKKDNDYTISLNDDTVLEHILKNNKGLFESEIVFNQFCENTGLKIENFIIPAKFSSLQVKLKEISIRLEMEQFFARRFLFTETLVHKIKTRLRDYTKYNSIAEEKVLELDIWINDINSSNLIFQQFKNFQQLYDMPKQEIKIENSENVNVVNGNMTDSNLKFTSSKKDTKDSLFDKKIKIIMVVLGILTIVVTLIVNWDKIMIP